MDSYLPSIFVFFEFFPKRSIKYSKIWGGGVLPFNWSAEKQYHLDCHGVFVTEQVISGTLKNGGTATWNVNEMVDYGAC